MFTRNGKNVGSLLVDQAGSEPVPEPSEAVPAEVDDLDALRAEAEALGVKVDGRWGAERLHEEIENETGGEG